MFCRENMIKAIEHHIAERGYCRGCTYEESYAPNGDCGIFVDALALLREQEPRVMTLEEIRMHEVYWAEQENVSRPWPIAMHHIRNAGLLDGPIYQDYMGDNYNTKEYGKTWRCWTARPTDEQRKAVKWDAADETRLVRHYSRPGVYADLWLHCEKCGGMVDDRYAPKYCPDCGRKVKWDG